MRLQVKRYPDYKSVSVEGLEARTVLKEALREIGQAILMPQPPFTGQIRRRALDRLKSGGEIWTEIDEHGYPHKGTIICMPLQIVGIRHEDGTFEPVGDIPKE